MSETCAYVRLELGIYLLGAIEPAGRAIVERHLDACPGCREELASLAGLPALMRRIPDAASILASAGPSEDEARIPPAALQPDSENPPSPPSTGYRCCSRHDCGHRCGSFAGEPWRRSDSGGACGADLAEHSPGS
jgi:hypothetical protein